METVLISGAGIAGSALARCLLRQGITPVVVERAPRPRSGGQAVDVRGAALTVLRRMGLEGRSRALQTKMHGMTMLDGNGVERYRSDQVALSSGRLDSEDVEILRDDLVGLLHEESEGVDYRFGDAIDAIDQDQSGVTVRFTDSKPGRFDAVVGADGLHSNTRRLVFGPEASYLHHLGTYLSVFSTDNFLDLRDWQVWFQDGGTGGAVMTARDNAELRVFLGFGSEVFEYDHHDVPVQKRAVAEHLDGVGWEVPNLIERMWKAEDFYFDSMAQIRMAEWSQGRVALLGDAAYCSSPLTGQGTSLALVGAYVLASELGRAAGDPVRAFGCYESRMRRFTEMNQDLVNGAGADDLESGDGPNMHEAVDKVKDAIELDAAA